MKVSTAGISLKECEIKVYESLYKKNNSQDAEEAKIVSSEHIVSVTGHRGINFLNDHDEADEEELDDSCSRPNKIMKTPALIKKQILY